MSEDKLNLRYDNRLDAHRGEKMDILLRLDLPKFLFPVDLYKSYFYRSHGQHEIHCDINHISTGHIANMKFWSYYSHNSLIIN